MQDNFLKRKQDILSKKDKSSIGSWDKKILDLCEKINKSEKYYTTSSCAGRVVLIVDDKRRESVFLKIYHEEINFKELKNDLEKIGSLRSRLNGSVPDIRQGTSLKEFDKCKSPIISRLQRTPDFSLLSSNSSSRQRAKLLIKFKQEPPTLHVACRNLDDAQCLVDKARLAGWKRSGIITTGKRFVVELMSTEKLEFLIMNNNRLLVNNEFLELVVKKSNENLKGGWLKIENLKEMI